MESDTSVASAGRWACLTASAAVFALLTVLGHLTVAHAEDPESAPAPAASATGSGPLETEMIVEALRPTEHGADTGAKHFVVARRLKAGEEVYYTLRVRNPGKAPVEDVVVTKQLPLGVDYVRGSAAGPACDIEFSTDGGETFGPAAKNGGPYTHVRWILSRPLAPGATALLRFRAIFR
jgi:uncharacterized repeat protein (TIGR01451 family)